MDTLLNQPSQTQNTPSPTPTPTPSPSEEPTELDSITKPSIPEFTLKFVDLSYDVPPTYTIDPYTGENVIASEGRHVENLTMQATIKNQLFTPYEYANGNYTRVYYNFRYKGHYEDEWHYYPYDFDDDYCASHSAISKASKSYYTIILLDLGDYGLSRELWDVPTGGQVDFQVAALDGYETMIVVPTPWGPGYKYEFTGEISGWSETVTITFP